MFKMSDSKGMKISSASHFQCSSFVAKRPIKWIKAKAPALLLCTLFSLIGLLLMQNEIYQDDWYIEASADGFFGAENRSLFVLGPNFIVTGLIYLLSLTGLRLFWLRIILLFANYISYIIVSTQLYGRISRYASTAVIIITGLALCPLVFFELQFTTTAALTIAAGLVALMYAVKEQSRLRIVLASAWTVFGAAIRFDCVYYGAGIFGVMWLAEYLPQLATLSNARDRVCQCARLLAPFLLTLLICVGVQITQNILLNYENPGFSDWNSTRTRVDDYAIPEFSENKDAYENIGIAEEDYQLLRSWNNLDDNFFSQEKYQQILDLDNEDGDDTGAGADLLFEAASQAASSAYAWIGAILLGLVVATSKKRSTISEAILPCVVAALYICYFIYIGRYIWRTERPIWICLILALGYVVGIALPYEPTKRKADRRLPYVIMLLMAMFTEPFSCDHSIVDIYKTQIKNENTILTYLIQREDNENAAYATYCPSASEYLEEHKEYIFYPLWQKAWLQQYPLYGNDPFSFPAIGAGENWGTLGQYMSRLKPIRSIRAAYGNENPFESITNENVRTVCRIGENDERISELQQYLRLHYDATITYSVDGIVGDCVIGSFSKDIDGRHYSEGQGNVTVCLRSCENIPGMVTVDVCNYTLTSSDTDLDKAEVVLESSSGVEAVVKLSSGEMSAVTTSASVGAGDLAGRLRYQIDGVWFETTPSMVVDERNEQS